MTSEGEVLQFMLLSQCEASWRNWRELSMCRMGATSTCSQAQCGTPSSFDVTSMRGNEDFSVINRPWRAEERPPCRKWKRRRRTAAGQGQGTGTDPSWSNLCMTFYKVSAFVRLPRKKYDTAWHLGTVEPDGKQIIDIHKKKDETAHFFFKHIEESI